MEHDYNVLYDTIKNIVEVETMPTMLEKWVADHKDEWEARGKAEAVLTVLRTRFRRVPKDVERAIRQMTDSIALDSWTAQAATCQSMDEFAEALK